MRKKETVFIYVLPALIGIVGGITLSRLHRPDVEHHGQVLPDTKFGNFLAAQHAILTNDFESAMIYSDKLQDTELPVVSDVQTIAGFLNGVMPENAASLSKDKGLPARFVYDAYLVNQGDWAALHARHKSDDSALVAPFRIWPAIANNWRTNTFKFIDDLPTNDSWKSFIRGQIYAELGDTDKAIEHFSSVSTSFMNINDYLYLMSFYTHHNRQDLADALRKDFTSRPVGMFMLEYDTIPDWNAYSGYANQMAFSLVQTVSHTQILMHSDMAVLMLRFAQISAPSFAQNTDAINYYLGQYFYTNGGDYHELFKTIDRSSPFYLFTVLRDADKTGDIASLKKVVKDYPLFVPALNKLVGHYIQTGRKRAALSVINNAMSDENLDEQGRAFFLKSRAYVYYAFGDYRAAQDDLDETFVVLVADAEMRSLQAKLWAAQNKNIETAYDYAMQLITYNPTNIMAWDTLCNVVAVREGPLASLDLLESISVMLETQSSLFVHMGDMYVLVGDYDSARDAYMRAIDLSDDGLVVVPEIERKLRKLK